MSTTSPQDLLREAHVYRLYHQGQHQRLRRFLHLPEFLALIGCNIALASYAGLLPLDFNLAALALFVALCIQATSLVVNLKARIAVHRRLAERWAHLMWQARTMPEQSPLWPELATAAERLRQEAPTRHRKRLAAAEAVASVHLGPGPTAQSKHGL